MSVKVCVLLAAFNGEKFIRQQINSILSQKGVELDIYIRLDPSIDSSASIIEEYVEDYDNVFLIHAFEASGSAGQNFFRLLLEVDFSAYDYLAFADQDDIWLDDKLSAAINLLGSSHAAAYSSNVVAWWESGREKMIVKSFPQVKYDYLFESAGPGCTFVLRTDLASELKRYIKNLGEDVKSVWLHDWFCYAFARSRGFDWVIDVGSKMKYRQHESNSVGANSGFSALKSRYIEVASGSAFEKVISQAYALDVTNEKPITLLLDNKFLSSIRLALQANQCRRKFIDKVFFALAMIVHAFGRL